MLEELKQIVCAQNRRLPEHGLVILTEGNVSQISSDRRHVVIKPSGVPYDQLTADKLVVVDMAGQTIEGSCKPSTDTLTHIEIYKHFPVIGGIAHTHSPYATIFAQMNKPIPCYGTTHADDIHGSIPVARTLDEEEIAKEYELNLGRSIAEGLDPSRSQAILVPYHGVFTVGGSAQEAVDRALILEKVAMMALWGDYTETIPPALRDKHFFRKHGPHRYYGQS